MHSRVREALQRMRGKYARVFGVELCAVHAEEDGDGGGRVWADGLPVWTFS